MLQAEAAPGLRLLRGELWDRPDVPLFNAVLKAPFPLEACAWPFAPTSDQTAVSACHLSLTSLWSPSCSDSAHARQPFGALFLNGVGLLCLLCFRLCS